MDGIPEDRVAGEGEPPYFADVPWSLHVRQGQDDGQGGETALCCMGTGGNGKSVIFETVSGIFGKEERERHRSFVVDKGRRRAYA